MIGPSPGLGAAQERWMTDTAIVWRHLSVPDGGGGSTTTWSESGTTKVMVAPPTAAERQAAGQEGLEITHMVVLPLDANVARGDRLVVGGRTIEIVSAPTGTHSTVKRAHGREEPWDEPIS